MECGLLDTEERSTVIDDSMMGRSIAAPAQVKTGKLGMH